jgi:hypothetical protein
MNDGGCIGRTWTCKGFTLLVCSVLTTPEGANEEFEFTHADCGGIIAGALTVCWDESELPHAGDGS